MISVLFFARSFFMMCYPVKSCHMRYPWAAVIVWSSLMRPFRYVVSHHDVFYALACREERRVS